jgi:hypothetical protein
MRGLAVLAVAMFGFVAEAKAQCEASASAPWASAKNYGLMVEAHAVGPVCATAALVLSVVDSKGVVLWSTTRLAHQNAMFAEGVSDNAGMKAALAAWLAQGLDTKPQSTMDLPEWKPGQDQAEREGDGEFGFYAGPDVTQEAYAVARAANQPVFCFVQGIESTSCIAASGPDSFYDIGGFTFPG